MFATRLKLSKSVSGGKISTSINFQHFDGHFGHNQPGIVFRLFHMHLLHFYSIQLTSSIFFVSLYDDSYFCLVFVFSHWLYNYKNIINIFVGFLLIWSCLCYLIGHHVVLPLSLSICIFHTPQEGQLSLGRMIFFLRI